MTTQTTRRHTPELTTQQHNGSEREITERVSLKVLAVARPQTTAFGEYAYPDIWTKAAALLHPIVTNHALVDGNKRLGWLATAVFLEINGIEISRASNHDVDDLVVDVAAGQPTIDMIVERLRQLAT